MNEEDWKKIKSIVENAVKYATLSVGAPVPDKEAARIAEESVNQMKEAIKHD